MRVAIVGGGVVDNHISFAEEIKKCDYIICADGGIKHLINVDIPPDVFIGDFDSCDFNKIKVIDILKKAKIIEHNPIKDDTDMQLCINYALDNGFKDITMFASLGGRVDHMLSNIYNLKYILDNGGSGMIFSDTNRIYITDNSIKIRRENDFKLSVIPLTPTASGVTLKGLYYLLEKAVLNQGTSLGISNEFVDEYAEVFVEEGVLLLVMSKDTLF